jgi:hypothetical protein
MYEHHKEPLISSQRFIFRIGKHILIAGLLVAIALSIGILGYHYVEGLPWIDAFAEAAMILSGMGPLSPITSNAGKLFAGFYALFSGLVFISIIGIISAPILHRFFHAFHLEGRNK